MMDIRKLKGTPVRLVYAKEKIIGCFYNGDNFIGVGNFTDDINDIIAKRHAETLKERIESGDPRLF